MKITCTDVSLSPCIHEFTRVNIIIQGTADIQTIAINHPIPLAHSTIKLINFLIKPYAQIRTLFVTG